jgi:hypothetical protein
VSEPEGETADGKFILTRCLKQRRLLTSGKTLGLRDPLAQQRIILVKWTRVVPEVIEYRVKRVRAAGSKTVQSFRRLI